MRLLREHRLPFGISTCYTSANYADISSEAFFDYMIDAGALFCWFFHYMRWGTTPPWSCCPRPSSGKRSTAASGNTAARRPSSPWTSKTTRSMCTAASRAGQSYLHINAKGDVEALRVHSLLQLQHTRLHTAGRAQKPLFMAYHDNRPFNENMLRPCPMLENPEKLRAMVKATGAVSTDYESPSRWTACATRPRPMPNAGRPRRTRCGRAAPHAVRAAPGKSADELHRHSELQDIHRRDRGLCAGNAGRPAAHFGHSNGGRVRTAGPISAAQRGNLPVGRVLCHAAGGRAGVHVANQPRMSTSPRLRRRSRAGTTCCTSAFRPGCPARWRRRAVHGGAAPAVSRAEAHLRGHAVRFGGRGLLVCGAVRRQYAGMPVDALAEWVVQNRLKGVPLVHGGRVRASPPRR